MMSATASTSTSDVEGDVLRDIVNDINNILEDYVLCSLLAQQAKRAYPRSNSPEEALSEVLQLVKDLKKIAPSTKRKANRDKLFVGTSNKILPSLNISTFDSDMVLELILRIEALLCKPFSGRCKGKSHTKCCINCDHSSSFCTKCKSNNNEPTGKCDHKCQKCNVSLTGCQNIGWICCKQCKRCLTCNEERFQVRTESVINSTEEPSDKPCVETELRKCLEKIHFFRHLGAHTSKEEYKRFVDGKIRIGEFADIRDYDQLESFISYAISVILDYIQDCYLLNKDEIRNQLKTTFRKWKEKDRAIMDKIFHERLKALEEKDDKGSMIATSPEQDFSRLQLEKNSKMQCILSTSDKIEEDDVENVEMKEKEDEDSVEHWEAVEDWKIERAENTTYLKINYEFCADYFYDFKLQVKTGGGWCHENLKGIDDCDFSEMMEKNILLIAFNDGKPDNIHLYNDKDVSIKKGKFKRKFQDVPIPASNVEDFRQRCKEYHSINEYVKRFPPERRLVSQKSAKYIGTIFEKVLKENYFVITGHQFLKQLELCGFSIRDLEKKLQLTCSEDGKNDSLLIFDLTNHVILNVCITDSVDFKTIRSTVELSNKDMKAFFLLHESTLSQTFASVIAVVACPNIERRSVEEVFHVFEYNDGNKAIFDILFLTSDDLKNENTLKMWLDKILIHVNNEKKIFRVPKDNSVVQKLKQVLGETMATKAVVYLGRVGIKELSFPVFSSNANDVVRSLFLNLEQFNAIESDEQHKIIIGPFGSGKSVILKEITRMLTESEEKSTVFFVCCDPYSLLETQCKRDLGIMLSKISSQIEIEFVSITELAKKVGVEDFRDQPEIIKRICDKSDVPVSFLLDEVSGENITEEIARKFKNICTHPRLNFLVIAAQSTQKIRTIQSKEKKTKVKINQFDKMDMKTIQLKKRMRMTGKIDTLMKIAEQCVEKLETKSKLPITRTSHERKDIIEQRKPSRSFNYPSFTGASRTLGTQPNVESYASVMKRTPLPMSRTSYTASEAPLPPINIHRPVVKESTVRNVNVVNPKTVIKEAPTEKVPPVNKVDTKPVVRSTTTSATIKNEKKQEEDKGQQDGSLFETEDLLSKLSITKESSTFLTNKNKFQDGVIGHGLEGDSPHIYYLPEKFTIHSATSVATLSAILKCIFDKQKDNKTTIVCSTKEEIWLVCLALKKEDKKYTPYFNYLLNWKLPSADKKNEICNEISKKEKTILVTDYRGFRGCESEHCVVFVRQESSYKDHVLVEALARAIAYIDVLVLPDLDATYGDNSKTARLSDVLTAWKEAKDKNGEAIVDIIPVHDIIDETIKIGDENIDVSNRNADYNCYKEIKNRYPYKTRSEKEIDRQLRKRIGDDGHVDPTSTSTTEPFVDKFNFRPFGEDSIDFLKPHIFGKVIGKGGENLNKLNSEFNVRLRVDNNLKKIFVRGHIDNKNALARVLQKEYSSWEEVFTTSSPVDFQTIVDIVNKSRKKFNIKINIDRKNRIISCQGQPDTINKFRYHLYNKITSRDKNLVGKNFVFCSGLPENATITLRTNSRNKELSGLNTLEQLDDDLVGFNNNNFKKEFLNSLKKAKRIINGRSSTEAICHIMLHAGRIYKKNLYSERPAGTYSKQEVFTDDFDDWQYVRLNSEELKFEQIQELEHLRSFYRFDMTFFTPYPHLKCRYKLFLEDNSENPHFISHTDSEDRKAIFANISSWHGYFEVTDVRISRMDVVDPTTSLTSRLNVSVLEKGDNESMIDHHTNVLENQYFSRFEIGRDENGIITLKIPPEMPEGFLLCFLRRSQRNIFKLEDQTTTLHTSKEKVLVNNESNTLEEYTDVFFHNKEVLRILNADDWDPENLFEKYKDVFDKGTSVMKTLLNSAEK